MHSMNGPMVLKYIFIFKLNWQEWIINNYYSMWSCFTNIFTHFQPESHQAGHHLETSLGLQLFTITGCKHLAQGHRLTHGKNHPDNAPSLPSASKKENSWQKWAVSLSKSSFPAKKKKQFHHSGKSVEPQRNVSFRKLDLSPACLKSTALTWEIQWTVPAYSDPLWDDAFKATGRT